MAQVFMAAYTNYRRDPRVKREAEALVEAGHKVVFLARRSPGSPKRETVAGVEVINALGLRDKCTKFAEYIVDYFAFFLRINFHLLLHPLRYRLIHISNMKLKTLAGSAAVLAVSGVLTLLLCELGARIALNSANYLSVEMVHDELLGAVTPPAAA